MQKGSLQWGGQYRVECPSAEPKLQVSGTVVEWQADQAIALGDQAASRIAKNGNRHVRRWTLCVPRHR